MKRKIISAVAIAIMAAIVSVIMVSCGAKKIKVTFDLDGGKIENFVLNQEINDNSKITKPTDPVKENHEFLRWEVNGGEFNFDQNLQNDITIKAVYAKLHNITFDLDEGKLDGFSLTQKVKDGQKISKPNDPIKAGYKFIKWELNEKEFNFDNVINSDVTLKAVYVKAYNVTFKIDGSDDLIQQVVAGEKVMKPQDPIKTGYKFVKWELNEEGFNFDTAINSDLTLKAVYVKVHNVTFDLDEGKLDGFNLVQQVIDGEKVTKPNDPVKDGCKFVKWINVNDNKEFNFDASINGDVNIKAVFDSALEYTEVSDGYSVSIKSTANDIDKLIIPEKYEGKDVTKIGSFAGMTKLTFVSIPNTVKEINPYAFPNSALLKEYEIRKIDGVNEPKYMSENGVIFSSDQSELVLYPVAKEGETYEVPATVIIIGEAAFKDVNIGNEWNKQGAGELINIVLPNNLKKISEKAFLLRNKLKNVSFKDKQLVSLAIGDEAFMDTEIQTFPFGKLESIGESAFEKKGTTKNLFNVDVVLPEGLKTIGKKAFYGAGLRSITIPASVTSIGESALEYSLISQITFVDNSQLKTIPDRFLAETCMGNLTNIVIPTGITHIGNGAFENSNKLTGIKIPSTLKTIGKNVFSGCTALTIANIEFEENDAIEKTDNAIYTKDMKRIMFFRATSNTFDMPNEVEEMDAQLFQLDKTTKNLTLSNKLKNISYYAFGYSTIENIVIPDSVEKIEDRAFRDMLANIITIEFGENSKLKEIGDDDVFTWINSKKGKKGIVKISSENVLNVIKSTIDDNAFLDFASELHVPNTVNVPDEIKNEFSTTDTVTRPGYTIYKNA